MDLELNKLSAVDSPIEGEVRLADPDGSLARDGIRFPEPFHIEGSARRSRGMVVIGGHVTGVLELECGRCLGKLRQPIDLRFEARHAEAVPVAQAPASTRARSAHAAVTGEPDDGLLLEREDLDVSFLPPGTTALRVEDVVREQVLLEVPIRPLCRPDCKGLCPRCGADLNAADCGCLPEETHDLRLAGLAALKKRLEDGSGREPKN